MTSSPGQANRLSVFVQRFEPNVDCFNDEGKPPFNQQCLLDLSYMPVSDTEQVFGRRTLPTSMSLFPFDLQIVSVPSVLSFTMR